MSILVVGSVAFDSIQTPSGAVDHCLGGAATHFALAASYFTDVRVIAVVGKDFTAEHEAVFTKRGIDTRGIERADGLSFHWSGSYVNNLNEAQTFGTDLNVFQTFEPKIPEAYKDSDYLFLANIDPVLQARVRSQMTNVRIVCGDTMNYWIARKPDRVLEVLRRVDVALLNEEEARALAGETHLSRAAESLLAAGAHAVIIKKGEHGANYHSREERFLTPAYPVQALTDPTGAGDSFAGGFMGLLARTDRSDGEALRQAMACGTAMASMAIESFSPARLVDTTPGEIEGRVRELHELVHYDLFPMF